MSAIDQFNRIGQVNDTAAEVGIRPELLHSVMRQESGGNPNAVSPKGAVGVMQTMPSTARDPGFGVAPFNPNNPEENLRGGAQYLKAMLDRYPGDEAKALAAYNAGPGRVDKAGGVPNIPETQQYVKNILGRAVVGPVGKTTPIEANPNQPPVPPAVPQRSAIDLFNSIDVAPQQETPQAAVARLAQERATAAGPSATSRFIAGVGENLNPMGAVRGVAQAIAHPIDTGKAIVQSQLDQFGKAKADYDQGHYSEMAGHALAGALPIVGPAAARAGEAIGSGDVAGGLGQAAGLVGSVIAPEAIGKSIKGAGNVLSGGAERIINSNVKPGVLAKQNPGVNIPRTILDEGFGPGARGATKAANKVGDLSNELTEAVDNASAKGAQGSLQPMLDHLDQLEEQFRHQPNSGADLAAVAKARESLMSNPLYAKDVMGTALHPPAMGDVMSGYATTNSRVPVPEVVGREIIPQPLSEIDTMKKNVYQGLKGKFGREGPGPVEVDKAMGRGLKDTLNENVPAQDGLRSAKDINAQQSKVIVARNALDNMARRESSKYPLGLMDLTGGVAAAAGAAANPLLAIPPMAALLLKHPTTAFPLARVADTVGKGVRGAAPVAKAAAGAAVVGRGVAKAEFTRLFDPALRVSAKDFAQALAQTPADATDDQKLGMVKQMLTD